MADVSKGVYSPNVGLGVFPNPIQQPRDPTSQDVNYDIYQNWVNTSTDAIWILMSKTSTSGTVLANWETTSGSVEVFNVDAATLPGTDPVEPTASGVINVTGSQVSSGTIGANVIRTNSLAANTYTIEVQQAGEAAAQDTTLNGVCHFDSTHFNISNGFVTLSGGGMAIDSLTTNVGGPVTPNGSGAVLVNASTSTYTDGSVANTLKTELQGTNHAVFVGQGASTPATTISVGTTGQLLVGATGADPSFAGSAEGDFSFTQSNAASATNRKLAIINADTTSSASNAQIIASVGGTSSGDPHNVWGVGAARSYSLGADVSDSSTLKMTTAASASVTPSSGTSLWTMTSGGIRRMPLQPCFAALKTANTTMATGNGTIYSVIFNSEIFDQSNNYDPVTGIFTAPVTGLYLFYYIIAFGNLTAAHTRLVSDFWINGAAQQLGQVCNPYAIIELSSGTANCQSTKLINLNATETMQIRIQISNGTNTVTIFGAANEATEFGGYLLY